MAHGDNHAKRIVMDEAARLAHKLQNGSAGCPETQGEAVGLLVKMITPLYEAEFMTVEECERVHKKPKGITKLKFGPFSIEGMLTPTVIVPIACNVFWVFALGRIQSWW